MATTITNAGTNISTTLPLEAVTIYSKIAELEAAPRMAYDDTRWVEQKGEFKAENSQNVYWTVYTNLTPTVEAMSETSDKDGMGFNEFQTHFTVYEYGNHIDWTQKAQEFTYTDPSLEAKVRQILGPNMGDSRDALCRNAWISGLAADTRMSYAGGAAGASVSARALIPTTGYLDLEWLENISERLSEDNFLQDPRIVCLAHRRAIRTIRLATAWQEAQLYAGAQRIINGTVGSWGPIDFIEAPRGVLPNAGTASITAALAASAAAGASAVTVSTAAVALIAAAITSRVVMTLGTVGGGDDTAEEVTILGATGTTVTFANRGGLKNAHASGELLTEGVDVYPCIFFVQGSQPMGRGDVISPFVDLGPVTDTFKRIHKLFWYGLFGYGLIRPWYSWGVEVAAPPLTL